jgi:hypothetical protein
MSLVISLALDLVLSFTAPHCIELSKDMTLTGSLEDMTVTPTSVLFNGIPVKELTLESTLFEE